MSSSTFGNISIYDGHGSIENFIQLFQLNAAISKWKLEEQLTTFPLFLKGKAKQVWSSANEPTLQTTLADVFATMRKGCGKSENIVLMEFAARKIKPNETLSKYAAELKQMLVDGAPSMNANGQQALIKSQVCGAVPESMRGVFKMSLAIKDMDFNALLSSMEPDSTISETPAVASGFSFSDRSAAIKDEPVESNYLNSSNFNNNNSFNQARSQHFNNGNQRNDNNQRNFQQNSTNTQSNFQTTRPQFQRGNQRQFDGDCDYCKVYGHKMAYCEKRKTDRYNKQQQYSNNNSTNRGVSSFNRNNRSTTAQSSVNNTMVAATPDSDSFPYSWGPLIENNVITVVTMNITQPSNLIKMDVVLSLFGQPRVTLKALLDGGSTHSFIAPNKLSAIQASMCRSLSKSSNQVRINSATQQLDSACVIADGTICFNEFT